MAKYPPGKILVPVDFSPPSRAALEYAVAIGRERGARVHVLHVWEPPPYAGPPIAVTVFPIAAMTTQYGTEQGQAALANFLSKIDTSGVELTTQVLVGVPADVILGTIEASDFDLVVMGTHGRHGVAHFVLGSVAERIARRATCPVVTLHGDASSARTAPQKAMA